MVSTIQAYGVVFQPVYETKNYERILFELLKEREAYESISHEEMPTFFQHEVFVASKPYRNWWFIADQFSITVIGSLAVTRQNEVAIAILKEYRRQGWGSKALKALLHLYPNTDFLANINPSNEKSIKLFTDLGFNHIQNTYKIKR